MGFLFGFETLNSNSNIVSFSEMDKMEILFSSISNGLISEEIAFRLPGSSTFSGTIFFKKSEPGNTEIARMITARIPTAIATRGFLFNGLKEVCSSLKC